MNEKIPRIIHYCWFGKNPLNEEAIQCINSWKKYFPDYEIIQWDESNFDFERCSYAKDAYQAKKWAFVSDYARFKILYEHGGFYFDTDVEAIKSFNDIIISGPYFGKEQSPSGYYMINPGLGMAAFPHMELYKQIVEYYENIDFNPNSHITVCDHVTKFFQKKGYRGDNTTENIEGYKIYPPEYFCPKDYLTGVLTLTDNSHSIHLYSSTWQSDKERKFSDFARKLNNHYGLNTHNFFPLKITMYLYCYGFYGCIKKALKKIGGKTI